MVFPAAWVAATDGVSVGAVGKGAVGVVGTVAVGVPGALGIVTVGTCVARGSWLGVCTGCEGNDCP
jgi:hypothetical protein